MPTALLLLTFSSAPLQPTLFEARLSLPAAVEAATVATRGRDIYDGVRLTVSGSILTLLGGGFGALGAFGLVGAASATGSTRTVYTALGWTSAGFGMLLGAVGLPVLIVGIVKLASGSGQARALAQTANQQGALAVGFSG